MKTKVWEGLIRVRPNAYNYFVIFTKEIKKPFSTLRNFFQKQLTLSFFS